MIILINLLQTSFIFNSTPSKIPENLLSEFSMDGKIQVVYIYRDDSKSSEIVWPKQIVDLYIRDALLKKEKVLL